MGKILLTSLLVFGLSYLASLVLKDAVTMENFLNKHGYLVETHQVITEDGYILNLHRIPHGRHEHKTNKSQIRPPVFLMHAVVLSSFDWTVLGPGKALALVLADAGYDVWLGNNRGNTYSKAHTSMEPRDPRFWDYSYHEIGVYDLPAMIDKVLYETGYGKLTYVGMSEGVTSFLVMASTRNGYNEKVLLMNAFAPVTNMHNVKSPGLNFLKDTPTIFKIFELSGIHELFSRSWAPIARFVNMFPGGDYLLFQIIRPFGASHEQFNWNLLSILFTNFPSGISVKQLQHYVQGSKTGYFRPYDYGEEGNLKAYNSREPSAYDLKKVTAPMILYYGEDDYLINNEVLLNVVAKDLPNVKDVYKVPYKNFNHMEFVWGNNIGLLTDETLKNINEYNKVYNVSK